jgi:hypothetical protein
VPFHSPHVLLHGPRAVACHVLLHGVTCCRHPRYLNLPYFRRCPRGQLLTDDCFVLPSWRELKVVPKSLPCVNSICFGAGCGQSLVNIAGGQNFGSQCEGSRGAREALVRGKPCTHGCCSTKKRSTMQCIWCRSCQHACECICTRRTL